MLKTINSIAWDASIPSAICHDALEALESGKVLFLPQLGFDLFPHEQQFLSAEYVCPKTKNISFDQKKQLLRGANYQTEQQSEELAQMMSRYAQYTSQLISQLLPRCQDFIEEGRTSFRPVEIKGRKPASYRKDDTRLHVDAFPSTPLGDKRILRVFTNVNPHQQSRVWRLGAPFPAVVDYFQSQLKKPLWGSAFLLNLIKITKSRRSLYDHYMLQLHNAMKADIRYQQSVQQCQVEFPPGSSWIVFTDQVSHAAMSGQFTFEQTFYIPSQALMNEAQSPCKVLENYLQCALI